VGLADGSLHEFAVVTVQRPGGIGALRQRMPHRAQAERCAGDAEGEQVVAAAEECGFVHGQVS
jgi:hypothetical protein